MRNAAVFFALSALSAHVAAVGNFTIDPTVVPLTTRANWCTAEDNTCTTLCDGNPKALSCDPNTLNYTCLCQNGSAPGLAYYQQTIPTFICAEAYNECVTAHVGDAQALANCTTSIMDECGSLNPDNYTAAASSTSSSASATSTATGTATSAPATASATTTASGSGAMPTAMARYGNGAAAVALGVMAYLL